MAHASHLLIFLGLAGAVWAAGRFMADVRYANSDVMGASIRFDRGWLAAALALSIGLALRTDVHWWIVPVVLALAYVMILPLKWRVIRPLGRLLGLERGLAPGTEPPNGFARLIEIERRVGRLPSA